MNPPSDTPRTDALNDILLESGATGERSAHAFYKHAKVLERELNILKSKREAAVRYGADSLESDSIENSCNCLERTPEAHLHKPGCKYRLISERDAARRECELARQQHEYYRAKVVEFMGANEGLAKECERLKRELASAIRGCDANAAVGELQAMGIEQLQKLLLAKRQECEALRKCVERIGTTACGCNDVHAYREAQKALTNKL